MKSIPDLLAWLEAAPAGTAVPAVSVAAALREAGTEPAVAAVVPEQPAKWSMLLWRVPAETRLGPAEVLEAVGRPKSWLYRHTSAKAALSDKKP